MFITIIFLSKTSVIFNVIARKFLTNISSAINKLYDKAWKDPTAIQFYVKCKKNPSSVYNKHCNLKWRHLMIIVVNNIFFPAAVG